jgi:hypothetical protein
VGSVPELCLQKGVAQMQYVLAVGLDLSGTDKAELAMQSWSKFCDFIAAANVRFGSEAAIHPPISRMSASRQ